jgi:hypothetical protein
LAKFNKSKALDFRVPHSQAECLRVLALDRFRYGRLEQSDSGISPQLRKVEGQFVSLVGGLDVEDRDERIKDFQQIVGGCHELRQYRNNQLHSAFFEMKGGGEVLGMLRSNPKVKTDQTTGDVLFDEEALTDEAASKHLRKLGDLAFTLGQHYLQLIHWSPFDSSPKRITVPIHLEDFRRLVRNSRETLGSSSKLKSQNSAKLVEDQRS